MRRKYKAHSAQFKFKVALEAIKEQKPIQQLCQEFNLSAGQIYSWKKQLLDSGTLAFESSNNPKKVEKEIEALHQTIGRLKVENDFLERALGH